jgi:hypothetical protein
MVKEHENSGNHVWNGINTNDCLIGNQSTNSIFHLDGYLDNFFILSGEEMTSDEVATLHAQGRKGSTPLSNHSSTVKLFYNFEDENPFGEPTGNKFDDLSGQGNDSVSHNNVDFVDDFDFADVFPINFPSVSDIFGV